MKSRFPLTLRKQLQLKSCLGINQLSYCWQEKKYEVLPSQRFNLKLCYIKECAAKIQSLSRRERSDPHISQ